MDYSNLYNLLKEFTWDKYLKGTQRNNKWRLNQYSYNVGKVKLFRKGLPIVDGNKMKKNKYAIYNECKRLYPDHKFTGVMINKNMKCPPHKDKGNYGPVIIIGMGDYTGGELCYEGGEHDIKNKAVKFEASEIEHWVKDFTGDRYSAVLFNHKPYVKKLKS
tara:strand:- start:1278 stop:1760 length:483 start_codon:yes stop_codon:yes gene_type:complete